MAQKLSIIIPAFNEEKTILDAIKRVQDAPTPGYEKEIIVVEDGSCDHTHQVVESMLPQEALILAIHNKNCGKGKAIQTGLTHVTGYLVLIQDADNEYNPKDWPILLAKMQDPNVNVVYGSRNLIPHRRGYPHYVLGAKILTMFINILFGSRLTDAYTCYKLFRTPIVQNLSFTSAGFEWEAEVTTRLLKQKTNIIEVPISYNPRTFHAGKKIRPRDGFKGLWTILKTKLS